MSKKVDKTYCHCIQKVKHKNPNINPYAICTYSVYSSRKLKRTKVIKCDKYYDWNKMNIKELRNHAERENIKLTKNGKYIRKTDLIKLLK